MKDRAFGIAYCGAVSIPAWILGKYFPVIGGPVFGILFGMILTLIIKTKGKLDMGIKFTSKKVLQYAVILLGFGMNFKDILNSGKESLPIILSTISISLIISYLMYKILKMDKNTSVLIGVGSSICGGSAIAASSQAIDFGCILIQCNCSFDISVFRRNVEYDRLWIWNLCGNCRK